jgi:hypothetical protein
MPITKEDLDTAKQVDRERKEDQKQAELKTKEKAENEGPRKAISDFASDVAKGARNYGRLFKEGLGMKPDTPYEKKKGGTVKMKKGGTASARADGCAQRGKTRGKIV